MNRNDLNRDALDKPLTRSDLDPLRCSNPACECGGHGALFLHPRCHPGGGVDVSYEAGMLRVYCHDCEHEFIRIAVAVSPWLPMPVQ